MIIARNLQFKGLEESEDKVDMDQKEYKIEKEMKQRQNHSQKYKPFNDLGVSFSEESDSKTDIGDSGDKNSVPQYISLPVCECATVHMCASVPQCATVRQCATFFKCANVPVCHSRPVYHSMPVCHSLLVYQFVSAQCGNLWLDQLACT